MAGSWKRVYLHAAIIWLNLCLVFAISNLVAALLLSSSEGPNPVVRRHGERIYAAYPGWDRGDVDRLINESFPRPNYLYEPYTQFKERPRKGRYVTVSGHGFRVHDSQGPWPAESRFFNIFIFGGSTTFGYGLPGKSSIPARLQEHLLRSGLERPARVYNFGRGYYFSAQERVLFESLLHRGSRSDLAVFIDGANDVALWPLVLDGPRFSGFFRGMSERLGDPKMWSLQIPLTRYLQRRSTKREPFAASARGAWAEADWNEMIEHYFQNKRMIEALGDSFGTQTLFVWQPVPVYRYAFADHHVLGGIIKDALPVEPYRLFEEFARHRPSDPRLLILSGIQENQERNLYVDVVHYNDFMADLIAARIAEHCRKQLRLGSQEHGAPSAASGSRS